MNIFKNYTMALAASAIVATSVTMMSFRNNDSQQVLLEGQTMTFYTLNQDSEQYERFGQDQPNVNVNCVSANAPKCAIGFTTDHGETLDPNSLPETPTYESASNGWYIE